ncbi:MAG: prepilin-type N-terminal cleavage/methylation domain-containing protein [Candidatus Paceibacterota bacterium]
MKRFKKAAFTLIELLVVIAIIGILSALIVVGMSSTVQKATIAKAQVFSNSLRNSLMNDLISEWKLDNGSGTTATDSWSGGNTGTLTSFADTTAGYGDTHTSGWMSSSNCISGTCLKLDGSDDYLLFSSSISTNSRTQAGWFYFSQMATAKGNKIYNFNNLYQHNSNNYLYLGGTSDFFSAGIATVGWYHLALVFSDKTNNTDAVLYVNGVAKNLNQQVGVHTVNDFSSIGLPSSLTFFGIVDDVRTFNAAMPTSQVQQNYFTGLNRLLVNNQINDQEYKKRIAELTSNYAKN